MLYLRGFGFLTDLFIGPLAAFYTHTNTPLLERQLSIQLPVCLFPVSSSKMSYAIVAGLCAAGAGFFGKLPSYSDRQQVGFVYLFRDICKIGFFLLVRLSVDVGVNLHRIRHKPERNHVDILHKGPASTRWHRCGHGS